MYNASGDTLIPALIWPFTPNNGSWPRAVPLINHLTFTLCHRLSSTFASISTFSAQVESSFRQPPQNDSRPPFSMSASINVTEVIIHQRLEATSKGSHPLFNFSCTSIILCSAGRRIAGHESYLELIASGRWGHQFHCVTTQMAHRRHVRSANCKALIVLWGRIDPELGGEGRDTQNSGVSGFLNFCLEPWLLLLREQGLM